MCLAATVSFDGLFNAAFSNSDGVSLDDTMMGDYLSDEDLEGHKQDGLFPDRDLNR
jgi:hypothetical protein